MHGNFCSAHANFTRKILNCVLLTICGGMNFGRKFSAWNARSRPAWLIPRSLPLDTFPCVSAVRELTRRPFSCKQKSVASIWQSTAMCLETSESGGNQILAYKCKNLGEVWGGELHNTKNKTSKRGKCFSFKQHLQMQRSNYWRMNEHIKFETCFVQVRKPQMQKSHPCLALQNT